MSLELLLNEAKPERGPQSADTTANPKDSLLLDEYSRTVVAAVDRVAPAVVNIDIKHRFNSRRGPRETGGSGSGFIIAPDGFILTNSHVVHEATAVVVNLPDGREYPPISIGDHLSAKLAGSRAGTPNTIAGPEAERARSATG